MGTKFIAEVHDVLDQFGFEDITPRTQTDECPAPVPWLRSEFELVVDHLEHQDWTVGSHPPDSVSSLGSARQVSEGWFHEVLVDTLAGTAAGS